MSDRMERREFLRHMTGSAGALATASFWNREAQANEPMPTLEGLPRKKLPRIGFEMPMVGLGCASLGHAYHKDHAAGQEPFNVITDLALKAGISYFDTAVIYDAAQPCLGPVMDKHRKEVFLVSKTWKKTKDEALRDIYKSLELLHTDMIDLVHIHNAGDFTTEQAIGKDGCLAGIQEARKRGLVRFTGASGHQRPPRFVPIIETGEIDLIMVAMNFVDRHTYNFEERVVPTAQKHNVAVLAMKVLGGCIGWGYRDFKPGVFTSPRYHEYAIRYALEIPGVHGLVIGLRNPREMRLALNVVRNHRPLTPEEKKWIDDEGRRLAAERGTFLGPVEA